MSKIIYDLVVHQLNSTFIISEDDRNEIRKGISIAENRAKTCLSVSKVKYFSGVINPYNSNMYCVFLYWLSRIVYEEHGICELADKIYYLNKMLNSVDLFYAIKLPEVWSCEHPVGAVMGRAVYGNAFFFSQGCTVGGNWSKEGGSCYPIIGENVVMLSDSKVVGASTIGSNVILSANSYVINASIPENSIVFGQGREIVIKENRKLFLPWT